MTYIKQQGLRSITAPCIAPGPTGVAVRTRLKHLTAQGEKVLWPLAIRFFHWN